ncbi:MAG: crotonase, partial [Microbacterium sp.]|nr:crotonase [Microbacterium sp.]
MIDLTIADDVATVVLNAPAKLNALDEQALGELDAAYEAAEAAGVRALVLRGEGRAFCAGRDISGVDPR